MRLTESRLRQVIRQKIIFEHLHGWQGSSNAQYMEREIPPQAMQIEWFDEWKQDLDNTKAAIEETHKKMTLLSIDNPRMNTFNVDLNQILHKNYDQMRSAEKYIYCEMELKYLWEDLKKLWNEIDEELN